MREKPKGPPNQTVKEPGWFIATLWVIFAAIPMVLSVLAFAVNVGVIKP